MEMRRLCLTLQNGQVDMRAIRRWVSSRKPVSQHWGIANKRRSSASFRSLHAGKWTPGKKSGDFLNRLFLCTGGSSTCTFLLDTCPSASSWRPNLGPDNAAVGAVAQGTVMPIPIGVPDQCPRSRSSEQPHRLTPSEERQWTGKVDHAVCGHPRTKPQAMRLMLIINLSPDARCAAQ